MREYLLKYLLFLLVPFLALSEVTQRVQKNLTSNQIIQFGAEQLLPFDTNTTAIVTCVDGTLKAIDMERGMVLWSYTTGAPLYTSSHYPIIPSIDGELYLYTNDGVKKHIWNLRELVQKSPFYVPDLRDNSGGDSSESEEKGGIIYLGQKESQLFALEPRTGLMWKCGDDELGCATRARGHSQARDQHVTYIARVNYKVHAVDLHSGEAKWNVSYAEFRSWSDQSAEHVTDDVAPVTLVSSVDGTLVKLDDVTGRVMWRIELNSPVIHVHQSEISPKYRLLVKEQRALTQLVANQDASEARVFIAQSDGYLFALEPIELPNLGNDGTVVTSPWPKIEDGDTDGALIVISDLTPVNQCTKIDGKCVTGLHSLNTDLDLDPFSRVTGNTTTHHNTTRDLPGPYTPPPANHVKDSSHTPWLILGAVSALALIGAATLLHVRTLFRPKAVTAVKVKPSPAKPKTKSKPGKNKPKNSVGDITKKGNSEISRPPQSRAAVQSDGTTDLGGLKITTTILGYGSSGTIVYLGYFNGRKVAVKRLLIDFLASKEHNSDRPLREVEMLIKSDEHPHVIRYYHHEVDGAFLYLALQYCPLSLQQLMAYIHEQEPLEENLPEEIVSWIPNIDKRQLLYQLTLGVHYLHSRGIVHRDLKPQNVLIDERRHVKISDMGLAKHVTGHTSHGSVVARHKAKKGSAEESEGPVGTIGWTAPEVISQIGDATSPVPAQSLDVWSLGCLLSWVWTGTHPFGPRSDREWRIVRGQRTPLNDALAEDLCAQMTHADPTQRPDILSVLRHPFWWSASKCLRFLSETSDHVEALPSTHPLVVALHDGQGRAFGSVNDWSEVIDQGLIHDSGRYRRYNTALLRDLLRLIRNKAHHYRDLDADLQRKLGTLPDGFLGYFLWRFPNLVLYLYEFTKTHCSADAVLRCYFDFDPLQHHNTPL